MSLRVAKGVSKGCGWGCAGMSEWDHTFFAGASTLFSFFSTTFFSFFSSAAGAGAAVPSVDLSFFASFFFWFLERVDDMETSPASSSSASAAAGSSAARFLGLLLETARQRPRSFAPCPRVRELRAA